MIGLEHLADGSISDRNFKKLMSLVADTGGLSIRIRSGSVTAAGGVGSGTGFTVTKNATGDYTVVVAFSQAPVVIVGTGATATLYFAKLFGASPPTTSGFRVACLTPAGVLTDGEFHWLAVG